MGNAGAMIKVTSNISVVIKAKLDQIEALRKNPDPILRTVALAVLPELKHRVHIEGKDSSGGQIGTYSPGYMKIRTGDFANAEKISKGANKGKLKNAGKFTEAAISLNKQTGVFNTDKVGQARPKYNRSSDTKVILSLTRQMENDLAVVATGTGYGIGYLNPDNLKKARYCELTYKKKILTKLTKGEIDLAKKTAVEFTPEYLKSV
jgi:hypothetical protein